jgi:hypothetical protein
MCLVTVPQGPDMEKLRPIFNGSHRFTNIQTNLLLPRESDSIFSFIKVYKA